MEPERPIEKLLRAFGKKRDAQSGPPLEMHPATRRLLQAEASRRRRQPAERKAVPAFAAWLRWAYALCAAALVGLLAVILWPALSKPASEVNLAAKRAEQMPFDRSTDESAIATPASAAPLTPSGETLRTLPSDTTALDGFGSDSPGPTQDTARMLRLRTATPAALAPGREQLFSFEPEPRDDTVALTLSESVAAGFTGRFVTDQDGTADAAERPVLRSFSVEQNGTEVRVVDEDGSVYAGSMQSSDARIALGNAPGLAQEKAGSASTGPESEAGTALPVSTQFNHFQVAGTNRSLQRPVVFTGSLLGQIDGVLPGQIRTGPSTTGTNTVSRAGEAQASRLRIEGVALLGDTNAIPIRAILQPERP